MVPGSRFDESVVDLARRTAKDDAPLFIVAQVSCRWKGGVPVDPVHGILAERFQRVLNVNVVRGYRLFSFQMHGHSAAPGELHEAIVAVFERVTPPASGVTQ